MMPISDSQLKQTIRLDHALGYAVIQSWREFMPDPTSGLIHIEYHPGKDGLLEFLQVWASTSRGTWKLVCEFWVRPLWSHAAGLSFENDYHSENFARNLNLVMTQENTFSKLPDQAGLVQVYPPTREEYVEADRWIKLLSEHRDPVTIEPQSAA